ncbi:MAG: hypothetical protein HY815_22675, partial [Candidatus Riflebacteria bacterium]|nr:hypothetical protein [Candidatus Riflebacteria bacterium]
MMIRAYWPVAAVVAAVLVGAAPGLFWGLPSTARLESLLPSGVARVKERLAALTAEDEARKVRTSLIVPVRGQTGGPGCLAEHPDILAGFRRYVIYSSDWDENTVVRALAYMRPGRLQLDPRTYMYGGLFIYPIGGLIAVAGKIGAVRLRPGLESYLEGPGDFGSLYVIGRLFVLLLCLAGLVSVWWCGRDLGGPVVGLVTVLVFATLPSTQAWLTRTKPHLPSSAFLLA